MNAGTVRKRVILGFSAVILLMIALCAFAYAELRGIEAQAIFLRQDSIPGLYLIGKLNAASIAGYASVQQHVVERDPARMQQITSYMDARAVERLDLFKQYELTMTRAKDWELLANVKSAQALYQETAGEVLRLSADPKTKGEAVALLHQRLEAIYGKVQAAMALGAGYFLVRAIDRPLARLVAAMEPMRGGDFSQKISMVNDGEFSILADGLNLVTNSLQEMIRRVQKSGLQVNTSATEIAATAQEQLSTASEIAATTSEIGATSKEISTTSKELVQTIKEIAEVAEKTALLAGSGQTGLSRMKATMQQVAEASATINARLGVLSEKAGNIGTVVTTITKVADQTNLLSLNAAIEAEKAGDYGRGFAVVAAEIRRLADQTALATGDIEQMVKEMQSAVAAGVMGMDKFSEEVRRGGEVVQQVSEELSQIIHHVQALTPNFETVSEGMQSQSEGAQQISEALSQLSESSKQTVESLRQSNSAIEQLNDAARGLQDGVARFTLHA